MLKLKGEKMAKKEEKKQEKVEEATNKEVPKKKGRLFGDPAILLD